MVKEISQSRSSPCSKQKQCELKLRRNKTPVFYVNVFRCDAWSSPPPAREVDGSPASHLRRLRHQHLKEAPPTVPAAAGETNTIRAQRRSVISAPPPSRMKKPSAEKDSDEYRQRRERNNLAVKKSRMRSKQKAADTQQRVNELKEENERLEAKIKLLSKELSVLKDLFLEHAHNLADGPPPGSPAHSAANGQ